MSTGNNEADQASVPLRLYRLVAAGTAYAFGFSPLLRRRHSHAQVVDDGGGVEEPEMSAPSPTVYPQRCTNRGAAFESNNHPRYRVAAFVRSFVSLMRKPGAFPKTEKEHLEQPFDPKPRQQRAALH